MFDSRFDSVKIHALKNEFGGSVYMNLYRVLGGRRYMFKPLEFDDLPMANATYPKASFWVSTTGAQDLMDQLWDWGFHPTEGTTPPQTDGIA